MTKILDKLCCDQCFKDLGKAPEDWPKFALVFCNGGCEYKHFMFITASVHYGNTKESEGETFEEVADSI